jgi:hypothetical protein
MWVHEDGTAYFGRVLRDLARHPFLLGEVLSLRSRTNEALHAAAERLTRMMLLEELAAEVASA